MKQNMEPGINEESPTAASQTDGNVSFSRVTAVATGLMVDFMFVSLCRHFKEGNFDHFNETLSTLQAICQDGKRDDKTLMCAFLARVMHGKRLDVKFEDDAHVLPLMSAVKLWSELKHTVTDESLFRNITNLLLVQSVAVCLEKGERSSASSALKWFQDNHEFPQNLIIKLTTVVTQGETYHPFLMSFRFSRLLEMVSSYLDAYLERNPSDYLLKAATKMVQLSENNEGLEDVVTQDGSMSEEANRSTVYKKKKKEAVRLGTKRKLLSNKVPDVWEPDSCKKLFVSVRRISNYELSQMTSGKSMDTSKIEKSRKQPQKWTPQLDKYLMSGVDHHGEGKWARILMDFDFEGRTGTMLKDRWRVLKKAHKVG